MAAREFKVTWRILLPPILGILAFFLYLYIFKVDIPAMIALLQSVNPLIYFLAIIALILDTFLFTLSWRSLLNFLSVKLSIKKSFLYVWYGVFIDIMIPAESISGEISRVYLVTKEQNGTSGKVVASLVAHRLIGASINIIGLLVGMIGLLVGKQITGLVLNLTLFLIFTTTIFLILLILACIEERWTLKIINAVIGFVDRVSRRRWKLMNLRREVVKATKMFHSSMKEFRHAPTTIFTSLVYYIFSWLSGIAVSYLVFLSLGFPIGLSVIIVTNSIMVAIRNIPLGIPFEAGLPDITMPTLYTALLLEIPLDIRVAICATATILIRVLTVWLRFFIGFAVQQWLGIKTIAALGGRDKKLPETEKIQMRS